MDTWPRGDRQNPPPPVCAYLQLGLQQPNVLVLFGQLVQQKGHVLQAGDTDRGH